MAIAFRSSSTSAHSGANTVTKPAGVVDGDMLFTTIAHFNNGIVAPAGWTLLDEVTISGSVHHAVYWKAASSEPASYVWDEVVSHTQMWVSCEAWSGANVAGGTPILDHQHASTSTALTVTVPAVTLQNTSDALLAFAGAVPAVFGTNAVTNITWAAGLTEVMDQTPTASSGTGAAWQLPAAAGSSGTKAITVASDATTAFLGGFLVVLSGNAAPLAPTLTAPTAGQYVDAAAGFTATWTVNDPGDTVQAAYALRRNTGGGAYEYWNAGTAAWQGTIVWNTSATPAVTFPSGKWTNGTTYGWSVATQDTGGLQGVFAADRTLVASTAPVVVATAPTDPVTTTSRPPVTWTYSDAEGAAQESYETKIFTAAQYGALGFDPATSTPEWTSGVQASSGARSATPTVDLTHGVTYRAYVRASQAGGQWSAWSFILFTVTLDQPAAPTLTATADPAHGRTVLAVQGRDNLLSANQASFETDTAGWAATTGTLGRSTAQAAHGAASGTITTTGAGVNGATTPTGTSGLPVVAGKTYTALASFRLAAALTRTARLFVNWYTAAGSLISATANADVAPTNSGWTQAAVTAAAPANAAFAAIVVQLVNAAGASEVLHFDKIGLAPGSSTTWTRGGLSTATNRFSIERRTVDGTRKPLRGADAIALDSMANQQAVVYDREAPVNPVEAEEYWAKVVATL